MMDQHISQLITIIYSFRLTWPGSTKLYTVCISKLMFLMFVLHILHAIKLYNSLLTLTPYDKKV